MNDLDSLTRHLCDVLKTVMSRALTSFTVLVLCGHARLAVFSFGAVIALVAVVVRQVFQTRRLEIVKPAPGAEHRASVVPMPQTEHQDDVPAGRAKRSRRAA